MNISFFRKNRQPQPKTTVVSRRNPIFHTRILTLSILITVLLFSGYVYADVISAMGDSITHGHGQVPYPSVLQQLIDGTAQKVRVINYGLSGERSDQGVNRIDEVLAQSHPNYIIIMEGADDVIAGLSPASVKFNLGVMIDKSRGAGAAPILGNITPDTRFNANSVITSAYNPQINNLAGEKNVALVDAYGALISDWPHLNVDGLHPNSAGHRILAQNFYNVLPYSGGGGAAGGGDSGGGDSGGGGCFIATAAFGSINEIHVEQLRQFRDQRLLTNPIGQEFVRLYYKYSPPMADFIAKHEILRHIVQYCLYPLIVFSWFCLYYSWSVAIGIVISILMIAGMILVGIRKTVGVA